MAELYWLALMRDVEFRGTQATRSPQPRSATCAPSGSADLPSDARWFDFVVAIDAVNNVRGEPGGDENTDNQVTEDAEIVV